MQEDKKNAYQDQKSTELLRKIAQYLNENGYLHIEEDQTICLN